MHAAASYGHLNVLEYLISKGGNVNITDNDNETPLFVVESVEVARWLVDNGANSDWRNNEQQTATDSLLEDFPEVSRYLSSLRPRIDTDSVPSSSPAQARAQATHAQPSTYITDQTADALTSQLLNSVHDVMIRAEAEGREPDAELQQLVGRTVLEGVLQGVRLGDDADVEAAAERIQNEGANGRRGPGDLEDGEGDSSKRSRRDI